MLQYLAESYLASLPADTQFRLGDNRAEKTSVVGSYSILDTRKFERFQTVEEWIYGCSEQETHNCAAKTVAGKHTKRKNKFRLYLNLLEIHEARTGEWKLLAEALEPVDLEQID
jgi:hypothetical protein